MPRLWAKTVTFDSISVGDELPILVKWETEETIKHFRELVSPSESSDAPAPAGKNEDLTAHPDTFWGIALTAYVAELLEKGFKLPSVVAKGSKLELETLQAVHAGDTLVLSGSVTDKRAEEEFSLVECRVIIENQSGETVATAVVTVSL